MKCHRRQAVASGLLLLLGSPAAAQTDRWSIGGSSGSQWSDWSNLNVLVDATTVPGALQPLELRPDVNVVPVVFGAHQWELYQDPPNPLWVTGIPRMWRGFGNFGPMSPIRPIARFVDGDVTTFEWATNYGPGGNKTAEEFYTLAFGGPLPLERWMIQLPPPEITDPFGEPFANYVSRHGELSGGVNTGEAQSRAESDNDRAGIRQEYKPLETFLGQVKDNLDAPIAIDFPLQYLRHVRWKSWPDVKTGQTPVIHKLAYAEFELYGRGFAGEARLESKVVDLGRPVILGAVSVGISRWRRTGSGWIESGGTGDRDRNWDAGRLVATPEAEAGVEVRFKTGRTDDPRAYFSYSDAGTLVPVDGASWRELKYEPTSHFSPLGLENPKYPGWQGPVVENRDSWTAWSGAISKSGTRIGLPSGRYLQVLVRATSTRPTDAARLDSLSVQLLPLLVPRLVGEVGLLDDPTSALLPATVPGRPVTLTCAIRAGFGNEPGAGGAGFDAVWIGTPTEPDLLYLMVGDPPKAITPEAGDVHADSAGITLYLPNPVTADSELRIGLRTTLFTLSARIEGAVFNRSRPEARQQIVEGDATDRIGSNALQLIASTAIPDAIDDLQIEPRTITPNGDGRNDTALIGYTLYGVLDAVVEVTFFTLAGEPVRRLVAHGQSAGAGRSLIWDGRDDSGRSVAPGLYLCEVKTETSRGRFGTTTSVAVAF